MVACLNEVEETETFFISKVQSFSFAFNAVKKMMMMRSKRGDDIIKPHTDDYD